MLTPRQLEILQLAAEGLTNAAIGSRLHISAKTVKHQLSSGRAGYLSVYARLGAENRAHAVAIGIREGLIQ